MLREDLTRSMFCHELHVRVSSLQPRGEKIRLRFTLPNVTPPAQTSSPKRQTVYPSQVFNLIPALYQSV